MDVYVPPVWEEAGEPDHVVWSDVVLKETSPDRTTRCLWDFIALSDGTPKRLPSFVRKWGLLDSGGESPAQPGEDGYQSIALWEEAAGEVRRLLVAIAITEEGELVPETLLWNLRDGDRRDYGHLSDRASGGALSINEVFAAAYKRQLAYYSDERRAGRGLALQRELIVNLLGEVAVPPEWRGHTDFPAVPLSFFYSWDNRGRRLEARAEGVREIVASHLLSMFDSVELDVFICSVCGNPYSLETAQTQRRPRAGVKKLCSEACRKAAKRESNRSSWNKNKDRWRPSSTTKGGKRVRQTRKR